jgi:hypothetical protein
VNDRLQDQGQALVQVRYSRLTSPSVEVTAPDAHDPACHDRDAVLGQEVGGSGEQLAGSIDIALLGMGGRQVGQHRDPVAWEPRPAGCEQVDGLLRPAEHLQAAPAKGDENAIDIGAPAPLRAEVVELDLCASHYPGGVLEAPQRIGLLPT